MLSIVSLRQYFSKYFGFAVGVRFAANSIGAVVVSFILPSLFSELGYKITFLSLLVIAPIVVCYGCVSRHDTREEVRNPDRKSIVHLYKQFLQDKSFTICMAAIGTYFLTCFIPLIFMVCMKIT